MPIEIQIKKQLKIRILELTIPTVRELFVKNSYIYETRSD